MIDIFYHIQQQRVDKLLFDKSLWHKQSDHEQHSAALSQANGTIATQRG